MTFTITELLLVLIIVLLFINMIMLISRTGKGTSTEELIDAERELLEELEDDAARRNAENIADIRRDINSRLTYDAEENRRNRIEVSDMLSRSQEKLEASLKSAVSEMQESNRKKLEDIRTDINVKLDSSLNERLDSSFKNVGDQLNRLYVSLGELSKLENGVKSLNRTLTNVKTRGIFGEMQLENILAEVLPNTLYDKNVVTKTGDGANRDAVEFAVKIPDKEINGTFMYLPIDSKYPMDYYERIRLASENADPAELKRAVRELEQRVKNDAKDIRDKYLDPPNTTDFGIMFLPAESLYAEVLRIPGLAEECQNKYHVVLSGPSTMAALINSLSIGFRYMAVNKDSQNILKLLSAIKTQYAALSRLIDTAGSRLDSAKKATDELQHRADIINRKLSAVEEIDP
ncbi:MAG: DNA recombination protein RmuC, partial [Eubacteriales bacterium]|nr:DNA recombination protein RmuC [Eubacteriales bacterium]